MNRLSLILLSLVLALPASAGSLLFGQTAPRPDTWLPASKVSVTGLNNADLQSAIDAGELSGGGGSGDSILIGTDPVTVSGSFASGLGLDWAWAEGDPDTATISFDYGQRKAVGQNSLALRKCVFDDETAHGGILCEGATADEIEMNIQFQATFAAGDDITIIVPGSSAGTHSVCLDTEEGIPLCVGYAAGDASGNATQALTGDNATSFFGAGTLEMTRGGTGAGALSCLASDGVVTADGNVMSCIGLISSALFLESEETGTLRNIRYSLAQGVWFVDKVSGDGSNAQDLSAGLGTDTILGPRDEIYLGDFVTDGVVDGSDLQAAIDSCGLSYSTTRGGCTIILPRGAINIPNQIQIGENSTGTAGTMNGLRIVGQSSSMFANSPFTPGGGSRLVWTGGDGLSAANRKAVILIESCYNCTFEYFTIQADADGLLDETLDAASYGIKANPSAAGGGISQSLTIRNVAIFGTADAAGVPATTFNSTDVNITDNSITPSSNPYTTGEGPMVMLVNPKGSLPTYNPGGSPGSLLDTFRSYLYYNEIDDYWIRDCGEGSGCSDGIGIDATKIRFYSTQANAIADTNEIDLDGTGGTQDNVLIHKRGAGIFLTAEEAGDAGPPRSSQQDKVVVQQSWVEGFSYAFWTEALQEVANIISGGNYFGDAGMALWLGGTLDFAEESIGGCRNTNCVIFHGLVHTSTGWGNSIVSNAYFEVDEIDQVFMRLTGTFDATAQTYGGNHPITVRDSYLTWQGNTEKTLLEGTTQSNVLFIDNIITPLGATDSYRVAIGNHETQPRAYIDLAKNQWRPFYEGKIFTTLQQAGNLQLLMPPMDKQTTLGYEMLDFGYQDVRRCLTNNGFGASGTPAQALTAENFVGYFEDDGGTPDQAEAATWSGTNLRTRTPQVQLSTSAAADKPAVVTVVKGDGTNRAEPVWLGDTAWDEGGFHFYAKWENRDVHTASRLAVGLFGTDDLDFAPTEDFSSATNSGNSLYIGCDAGDSNLKVCANNGSGTAGCTDLGSDYPCKTDNTLYEAWIYARVGAGADDPQTTSATYRIHRIPNLLSGQKLDAVGYFPTSSGLPTNTETMGPAVAMNSGTTATAVTLGFTQMCVWAQH